MPLRTDIKYIEELEAELKVTFPERYKRRMIRKNGGVIETKTHLWTLYPFYDQSDNDHIIRTFQHIGLENTDLWIWETFPPDAIAIGKNEYLDFMILLPEKDRQDRLSETLYFWSRSTGRVCKLAESIDELEE